MRLSRIHINNLNDAVIVLIRHYALDILTCEGMKLEKTFRQHGRVSCYEHSLMVAYVSVKLAIKFDADVDMRSLVRGALLHDYFLYDWHISNKNHRLHGLFHASRALKNAEEDFYLTEIERDIIKKHMFPANPMLPRYKETMIVTLADKICATGETLNTIFPKFNLRILNSEC